MLGTSIGYFRSILICDGNKCFNIEADINVGTQNSYVRWFVCLVGLFRSSTFVDTGIHG